VATTEAAAAAPAADKLDFKKILPVFIIVLIDLLGLTIIIPLMPLYAASFGANAFTIGLLGAAYPVMQFIGAPFLGRLSDRYGRKPILLISQLGTLIGFLLLGFSNALWLLFLSRLVDGLSGANISTAQAVITDSTNEKTRTQGLGLLGAAFGLGFVVGPIIAFVSLTASGENYHVPAFLAAGFSALSILLTWFWLEETLPAEKRGKNSHKAEISISSMLQGLRRPLVGFLLVLMFAQQIAFGGFEQLLSLFTLNRLGLNASGNAVIFVFVGILVVAVQGGLIGLWSRKYGDKWLIYMGLATLSVGLILTAVTPAQPVPWYSRQAITAEFSAARQVSSGGQRSPAGHQTPATQNIQIALPDDTHRGWLGLAWILVAMIPAAIGGGVLQPAVNSMLTRSVPSDEVGGILGVSAAFLSGANVWAPVLGGALFQALGSTAPFAAGGVLLAVLWVIARRVVK
jgi:DHA1 family tetracycline resistance protein-like MFS transporter